MDVAALALGLMAAFVILPTVLLLCATKPKAAPIGASMANRRAAAMGRVQVDPLLKPDWAAKQAAQNAQDRQQHAVVLSSKNLRAGKPGTGGNETYHIVLRQPSTMADKYALPSHLTKQLGQSARRGVASHPSGNPRSYTPTLEGSSVGRRTPPLEPSPLTRPEPAVTDSSSASMSRSAGQDTRLQDSPTGGGAGRYGPASAASRRVVIATSPLRSGGDPGGSAGGTGSAAGASADRTSLELMQLEGDSTLRETGGEDLEVPALNGRTVNGAWPGLNDPVVISRVAAGDSGSPSPVLGAATATQGPRVSHPRVAALSPSVRGSGSSVARGSSGGGSGSSSGQVQQLAGVQGAGAGQPARPSMDLVEQLVAGVDWSGTALAPDGERRVSSAIGELRDVVVVAPPREQSSAPCSASNGPPRIRAQSVVSVPGANGRMGRTISSRDGATRSVSRLGSPLLAGSGGGGGGGGSAKHIGGGVSNRWMVGAGRSTSGSGADAGAAGPGAHHTSLPGSMDSSFAPTPVFAEQDMERADGSGEGSGGGALFQPAPPPPQQPAQFSPQPPRFGSSQRARGISFGTEASSMMAAEGSRSLGGAGPLGAANLGARGNATWSGMAPSAAAPAALGDGEPSGPRTLGGGGADTVQLGSRAARAQALLARNKSNLSRLAVTAAPGSATAS